MTSQRLVVATFAAAALIACGAKDKPAKQAPAGSGAGSVTAGKGTAAGTGSGSGSAVAGSAAGSGSATGLGAGAAGGLQTRVKEPMPTAYRDALRLGRKLGGDKKWSEAAEAFRAALAAAPDDPRALSELSWALFQTKELAPAKVAALSAVHVARNNVKAASLYNLGRILEEEHDRDGAANAYRESLALRPNKTVADRLARLDPSATAAAAMLAIEEWGPPAAARAATCDALGEDDEGYADWSQDGTCDVTATDVALTGGGPFAAITSILRKRSGSDEAFVAVQTADGWLQSPPFLSWGGVGTWGATGTIDRAEVITHPALGPVLRLDVTTAESGRWESWTTDSTIFCLPSRAGGSGALTCTPLLATSWRHSSDDDDAIDETCAAIIALDAEGAVTLVSRGGKVPTDCPIHLGRFTWPRAR